MLIKEKWGKQQELESTLSPASAVVLHSPGFRQAGPSRGTAGRRVEFGEQLSLPRVGGWGAERGDRWSESGGAGVEQQNRTFLL